MVKRKISQTSSSQNGSVSSVSSSSNVQVTSSNDTVSNDVQTLLSTFQENIASKIAEYVEKFELESKERIRVEMLLKDERQKSEKLEAEKYEMAVTITTLNKSIDNMLEEKNQLDEKIKNLGDSLKTKENEWIDNFDKLRREKDALRKNLTDRLQGVIDFVSLSEDISTAIVAIQNQVQDANQHKPKSALNNAETKIIECQSSANNQVQQSTSNSPDNLNESSFEGFDSEETVKNKISSNQKRLHEGSSSDHENKRQKTLELVTCISDLNSSHEVDNETPMEINEDQSSENNSADETDDDESLENIFTLERGVFRYSGSESSEDDHLSSEISTNTNMNAVVPFLNPIKDIRRTYRKNIRKLIKFENLTEGTKTAYLHEKERKSQYAERLLSYNETYAALPGEVVNMKKVVLDFDVNTKRELLTIDKKLLTKLKPYQCEGIKFMWDACFESIEKLEKSDGGGCILAHCMGLGKTLQIIALVHTLHTHRIKTNVKRVLIICPVNVILNWENEFQIWLNECSQNRKINIYEMSTCPWNNRLDRMEKWHQQGGVLIIGYTMFRLLYEAIDKLNGNKISKEKKDVVKAFQKCLIDPGADLVVCDEGHLLKNHNSKLNAAVNKIRTLRRIVLTVTPLQNNLSEYGFVQRRDYSILAEFLPAKQEYVLFIRLTDLQISLYEFYIKHIVTCSPIADFAQLRKVCNHPKVLADSDDRYERKTTEKSKKGDPDIHGWWKPICSDEKLNLMESSNKMSILFSILAECEARNEKLLVFSSCLSTLNIIKYFLAMIDKQTKNSISKYTGFKGCWTCGTDYFRLDGTKPAEERKRDIITFNKETNLQARLFLVSTRAGSLGINLMAANRVVIFDASWNPSHDIQSVFRSYRIGQKKECYVYRLVALGSMEEKIYDRQITKLGIAKRVVDAQQIGRFYKANDLQQLYSVENINPQTKGDLVSKTVKDNLLNNLLRKHPDVIFKHHDHDSLLEINLDETLTQQEKDDVWKDFQNENEGDSFSL